MRAISNILMNSIGNSLLYLQAFISICSHYVAMLGLRNPRAKLIRRIGMLS